MRVALAGLHLLALGLGLMAVVARGTALREAPTAHSLKRAFRMDVFWAVAAGLWVVTGLWRLFGATEKPSGYYFENHWFLLKMALFVLIVALEIAPMMLLIRWRKALARGAEPASFVMPPAARRVAMISHIQALLVALMVFAAAAMARGYGLVAAP